MDKEINKSIWQSFLEFLFGPPVCEDCGLLQCEGKDVNCQCCFAQCSDGCRQEQQ